MDRAGDEAHLALAGRTGWTLITHNAGDFRFLHAAWREWTRESGVETHYAGILILIPPVAPLQAAQEIAAHGLVAPAVVEPFPGLLGSRVWFRHLRRRKARRRGSWRAAAMTESRMSGGSSTVTSAAWERAYATAAPRWGTDIWTTAPPSGSSRTTVASGRARRAAGLTPMVTVGEGISPSKRFLAASQYSWRLKPGRGRTASGRTPISRMRSTRKVRTSRRVVTPAPRVIEVLELVPGDEVV